MTTRPGLAPSLPALALALLAAPGAASAQDTVLTRDQLTGDWGGARTTLEDRGLTVSLDWTAEVLGNTSGGMRQGTVYEGLAELAFTLDLEKMMAWQGATFQVSGYWIQGRGLSEYYIGNLLTVSSIEADRGWRLNELYLEQALAGGRASVRVGQFTADTEFFTSDTAGLFVNSTFGWPGIDGTDLPSGGPAYPLPTPGVLLRWDASDALTLRAGVYNGDPAGSDGNDNGLEFPVDDGVFAIAELAYSTATASGLAGVWKLGAWYNSNAFDNLSVAANGAPLASPAARGGARQQDGNYSIYAMVDHQIRNRPDGSDGLSAFARVALAPLTDRSTISFYADAGFTYAGPFASRPDDTVGLAVAYAKISPDLADFDRDTNDATGIDAPVQDYEAVIEASYQAALTPAISLQPFAQYVIHPGGNIANPDGSDPTEAMGNSFLLGLRAGFTF